MNNRIKYIQQGGASSAAGLLSEIVIVCSISILSFSQASAQTSATAGGDSDVAIQNSETKVHSDADMRKTLTGKTQSKNQSESLSYAVGESLMPDYSKVILALLLVIGGIYGVVTLLKRTMGRRAGAGGRGDAIELIEALHLSPKKQITLVRVGTRGALLAVTEGGIQTLLELDNEETSEALELARSKQGALNFKDSLGRARKKMTDLRAFARKAAIVSPHRVVDKGVSESA